MRRVEIETVGLSSLTPFLTAVQAARLSRSAETGRQLLDGRVVWNINATAHGGGVAELLQTLCAYGLGAGVDTRWLVLDGSPDFFAVTKRLHNALHGDPGDGGPFGRHEHAVYRAALAENLADVLGRIRPGDIVLLHDPQPAGLTDGLRAAGALVVWRCHIGSDLQNELTKVGWEFVRHYVQNADAFVVSRRSYAPAWMPPDRLWVIPPSIDPNSLKNRDLSTEEIKSVLCAVGLVEGVAEGPGAFRRRDGSQGTLRPRTGLMVDGRPPPAGARLVVQVSRWDRLKDMAGVLDGFGAYLADGADDVHLMLAGPDVSGVADDPEGAAVLSECRGRWQRLPRAAGERMHLARIPMDDADDNALIVNALQRSATVVVQKSLAEGFGLTVAEAMWKGRPVIASAVGGIRDQVTSGQDGLLIGPRDRPAFVAALHRLLDDPDYAKELGVAAHLRVRDQFLEDRHLSQYVQLFARLLKESG